MSNANATQNLDWLAAKYAQHLVKSAEGAEAATVDQLETAVTKALGVLQEDGVYACVLYLLAKEGDMGERVVDTMLALLADLGFPCDACTKDRQRHIDPGAALSHIHENVTADLKRLMLVREVLEQMLVYVRYGAKAQARKGRKNKG